MSAPPLPPNRLPPSVQALGIDPNRVQVNRVLREAYQREQARLAELEQARREAEEARRAEEEARARASSGNRRNSNTFFNENTGKEEFIVQPTYDDPFGERAVSKSDVNPAYFLTNAGKDLSKQFDEAQAKAETAQDFAIYKALEAQGIDPGQLSIRRDASGNILSGSGSKNDLKLNIGSDNTLSFTYSQLQPWTPQQPPSSINEADIIGNLAGAAKFAGSRTQFGYAISKDAQGNIVGYNTSLYFPESVRQSPQALSLAYSAFKENQIINAQNAGAPSAYRLTSGDISNLRGAGYDNLLNYARQEGQPDFGYGQPISGKPFSFEYVGPYGQIAKATVSQRPTTQKEFYVPDPTNPFDVRTRDVEPVPLYKGEEPPKAPVGGALDAFVGTLTNLPKGVAKTGQEQIFKQTSDIELYPEVEGSVYSALLGLGGRAIEGKPADLNLLFFSRDMGNLGRMIQENPQWAAGSLAASAVFFIPNKVIKPLQFGIEALGLFGRATKQASKISQAVERIFDIETTGVQAAKISKTGSELIPLTKTRFGFTEARPVTVPTFRYAPVVNIPGTSVSLKIPNFMPGLTKTTARQLAKPDAFIIQSGLDDVGLIGTKSGTTEIARELVPREEAARLVGQGPGKLPEVTAKTYTEIAQTEASVLKRADAGIFTQGPTPADIVYNPIVKQTGGSKVSESIPFASLFGYSNKELLRSTRTFEAGLTVAGEAIRPAKPFSPFDFSKPASQGERAAEEGPLNLMMAGAKTEKQAKAITKTMIEGVKEAEKSTKNADLAKAALGLYGDTGSSRKANTLTGLGEGYDQFLVSPAGVDSLTKQYTQQFVTPTSSTKLDTTPIQGSKSFNPFNLIPKLPTTTDQKLTPLMTPFFTHSTRPLTVPITTQYTAPQTTPIQTPLEVPLQTPLEVPFNVPTTIPKPPREPRPPKIPVATSTTKKKHRPENPFFVRKGWTIWNVPNVFVINTKELYRNMGLLPPKKRKGQK